MNRTHFPTGNRIRRSALLLGLLLALALLAGQPGGARRSALAAPTFSKISGQVTREDGTTGVGDAVITASPSSGPTRVAATTATGAYSLTALLSDTYELSLRPTTISTTSPSWVYTGVPIQVRIPPDTIQHFTVTSATVTVAGQLLLPQSASGDFSTAGQHAWVRAENQEGQGNTVQVTADGHFTIKALPGGVLLNITLENQAWTVPTTLHGLAYYAQAGQTITVPAIQVLVKTAAISGQVTIVNGGAAPAGISVRAWRLDGSEFEEALTDSGGNYSMKVISGTWALRAVPLPDQLYGGQYYVPAQPPMPVRVLSDTAALDNKNLTIARADVTVSGSTVPASAGVNGRVYALYQQDGHPALGPTAPLVDGAFSSLRLSSSVATTYTFGVYFPPDVPYTALGRVTHGVTANSTLVITLPIALDNSHITGTLRLSGGAPVTGVPGSVWGASDSGGWARAHVNPATGGYDLAVATTDTSGHGGSTWYVRAFVDPASGYVAQRPRVQQAFLPFDNGAGSTIGNLDFTLLQVSTLATIHGRVTNPSGTIGVPGVRVTVREFNGDTSSALERWALTDLAGNYSVRVPPGAYHVSAHFGPPLIAPAPMLVTVGESGDQVVDLRFRIRDALVRGLVTYNGVTHPALVRARSEDGAVVIAPALLSDHGGSNYVLGLKAGLRWTLEAVAAEGSDFLRSNQVVISPTLSATPLPVGETLVLTKSTTIPDSQAFVFYADEDQIFTLSDGSQVQVPSGALAETGLVALTVRPLPELADQSSAQPVSFGYRLSAYDGIRRPISHFLRPVTLVIPFTRAQLDALGITSDRLIPSYWDEASASWKPVENVAVIPDDDGGGTVNITVDHFTDFALLGAPGGTVYLPLIAR
jgi:hypothetical protein